MRYLVRPAVCMAGVLASGCASIAPSQGRSEVATWVGDRVGSAPTVEATADRPEEATDTELDVDAAVRVAWRNNPRLATAYAELGLARADVLEASRLSNPTLSYSRRTASGSAGESIVGGVTQSFADVLLRPLRKRLAATEFDRVQRQVAAQLVDLAADVEAAWVDYVGARHVSAMRAAACVAAETSAELAQRYFDAGNITRLQLSMEQAALAQARIEALRATGAERRARSQLNRLLGLSSAGNHWRVDDRLALPPDDADDVALLQELARSQRLDLAAARRELEREDQALAGNRRWRWLGGLDLGYGRERGPGDPIQRGPALDIQLPVFNQGQAAIARSTALRDAAAARLRALELAIDNDVALAVEHLANAREIVTQYRSALIPGRDAVVDETQAEVAYMLVGTFQLIQSKQQAYDAYQAYLEALRDYWLARIDLARAVGGRLPLSTAAAATEQPDRFLHPPAPDDGHGMHHGGVMAPDHASMPMHHPEDAMPMEHSDGEMPMEDPHHGESVPQEVPTEAPSSAEPADHPHDHAPRTGEQP